MADFIVNTFAEIADFFINWGVDKVIDKLVKNKSKIIRFKKSVTWRIK